MQNSAGTTNSAVIYGTVLAPEPILLPLRKRLLCLTSKALNLLENRLWSYRVKHTSPRDGWSS